MPATFDIAGAEVVGQVPGKVPGFNQRRALVQGCIPLRSLVESYASGKGFCHQNPSFPGRLGCNLACSGALEQLQPVVTCQVPSARPLPDLFQEMAFDDLWPDANLVSCIA